MEGIDRALSPGAWSSVPFAGVGAVACGCHALRLSAASSIHADWAPLPIPSAAGGGSRWQEGAELRIPGSDVCFSGCCASGRGPYGNPGSPGIWRWAWCLLLGSWGRGGCVFLNPQGGTRASRLRGWHPGWEEASQAGSLGWDVLLLCPCLCPCLVGQEGREKAPGGSCARDQARVGYRSMPRHGAGTGSGCGTQPWLGCQRRRELWGHPGDMPRTLRPEWEGQR